MASLPWPKLPWCRRGKPGWRSKPKQGVQAGIFAAAEHEMVRAVFRLGDRRAGALMTPRTAIVWLDVNDPPQDIRRQLTESAHSRFPVGQGSLDQAASS